MKTRVVCVLLSMHLSLQNLKDEIRGLQINKKKWLLGHAECSCGKTNWKDQGEKFTFMIQIPNLHP